MQERQKNRALYFKELAQTSRKYFIPYIERFKQIREGMNVLEIGCGDGGNLLPFAEKGCTVVGVDMAESRIKDAIRFFAESHTQGTFIASDVFKLTELENRFDIIICHDVLEHLDNKLTFLTGMKRFLNPEGVIFMSFPAWQMPFGGHQQICKSKWASHLPFMHLLPNTAYRALLKAAGEDAPCINELMNIKRTRISIERFESLLSEGKIRKVNREFYFINPHYETKFHLTPRKLTPLIGALPYVRNFFTTSCFYILRF